MYDHFNLFYFFTSPLNFGNNTLLRVNNAFIEGINRREHLPKYIIMVLDRDLIDMINRFDFGISTQLERCVKWLAIQMERTLSARREQLTAMKAGVVTQEQTKFIWVEMFDRPATDPGTKIRNKFNKAINDLARQRNFHHILVLESIKENKHFEYNGKLNYWGKLQFWKELDYYVAQFDRRRATLGPRNFISNQEHHNYSRVDRRHRSRSNSPRRDDRKKVDRRY